MYFFNFSAISDLLSPSLLSYTCCRRHFWTTLTPQTSLRKTERKIPPKLCRRKELPENAKKLHQPCFKTFLFFSFFLSPPLLTRSFPFFLSFSTPLCLSSFLSLLLLLLPTPPPPTTLTAASTNRRGLNQAATVASSAATQAFGAMGQQVQKAAAQAAAQAAANEVQNQFSNLMRNGLKK